MFDFNNLPPGAGACGDATIRAAHTDEIKASECPVQRSRLYGMEMQYCRRRELGEPCCGYIAAPKRP